MISLKDDFLSAQDDLLWTLTLEDLVFKQEGLQGGVKHNTLLCKREAVIKSQLTDLSQHLQQSVTIAFERHSLSQHSFTGSSSSEQHLSAYSIS